MVDNKTRIIGVILLVVLTVLNSLVAQGVLEREHADLIMDVVVVALPLVGLGALVDVVNTERRRKNPDVPALKDDVRR